MNNVWGSFILVSFCAAMVQWLWLGNADIFSVMMASVFDMAKLSIEIALGLIGLLCFWMGMLKLAEQSGILNLMARFMQPLFSRLLPEIPKGHPALGHITMNMAANIFGLDNAATPSGIKAMESMQSLNPDKATATNAQIMFLVLNTSSVTLFPVTILMYRAQQGATYPADVFIPILLATSASTLVGLLMTALVQRIVLWDRVIAIYLLAAVLMITLVISVFSQMPPQQMASNSAAVGNGVLLLSIALFVAVGWYRNVPVYECFIDGAKEGFGVAVKIMPYLVAMLVAIGLLRSSGVFDAVLSLMAKWVESLGGDARFVDALPTGLMNPFSGSGARAMMLETMKTYGADSFAARLAAVFQGSTETTFYVLAVYFGAVNIKRLRHAIACSLAADVAGIVSAVLIAYWFFA